MVRSAFPAVLVLLGAGAPALAQTGFRQLEAHVHGVGHLGFVADGASLVAELETPLANLVGFEHAPETEAERQAYDDAVSELADPANLFDLSRGQCALASVNMDQPDFSADDHHHEDEHHHEDGHSEAAAEGHADHEMHDHETHDGDSEHAHADLRIEYQFECASLDRLDRIDVGLFDRYPGFQELDVLYVGDGSFAGTLTPGDAVFVLR